MIELVVKRVCRYLQLDAVDGTITLSTGLLDDAEAIDVATRLISAAEDLLPSEYNDQAWKLVKIREEL